MGVHGLWELLSPVGHRVSNEHVRNKVLAVDISIWLTQFVKAMRDAEGAQVRNAHLLGIFRRCIKLLYLSVRPVLIFDGATPALKRRTLAGRRAMRDRHEAKLRRLAERMLVNRMKISVLGEAIRRKGNGRKAKKSTRAAKPKQLKGPAPDAPREHDAVSEEIQLERQREKLMEEEQEEEEDRIEPVYSSGDIRPAPASAQMTIPPEVARIQEAEDAIFAADLADEEEALTRERGATAIDIPYDADDIDDETLQDLPAAMQSEIFKQIKLNQRARHRERMLLQRNDPAQFSRAQIEGFLQNTALNRKIHSARNALNHKSGASQRIASDSKRQFVLEDREESGLNVEDGFSSSSSSDDDALAGGGGSSRRRMGNEARAAPDILAQLRAKRDAGLGLSTVGRGERNQIRREYREKRSGVGWASRVLEGKGGLVLGGRSALGTSPKEVETVLSESDDDVWEDAGDQVGERQDDTRAISSAQIKSDDDDDDDDEWEDGNAIVMANDSNIIADSDSFVEHGKELRTGEIPVRESLRHENSRPRVVDIYKNSHAEDMGERNTASGKSGFGLLDIDEISEEDKGEKNDGSAPKHSRGLLDLDASSDEDVDPTKVPTNEGSLHSCRGTCIDSDKGLKGENVELGISDSPVSAGVAIGDGKVRHEQSNEENGAVSNLEVQDVDRPDTVLVHANTPNPSGSNGHPKAMTQQAPGFSGQQLSVQRVSIGNEESEYDRKSLRPSASSSEIETSAGVVCGNQPKIGEVVLSKSVLRGSRAEIDETSSGAVLDDLDTSGHFQPEGKSEKKVRFVPESDIVEPDIRRHRDSSEKHTEVIRKRRKADEEEDRDMQMAMALSLGDGTIQESWKSSQRNGESDERKTSSLASHLDAESALRETEKSGSIEMPYRRESENAGSSDPQEPPNLLLIEKEQSHGEIEKSDKQDTDEEAGDPSGSHARESDAQPDEARTVDVAEARHFEATEMSTERMQELRDELEVEERELQRQKTSHQGGAESVSEEMYGEARDLLKLFGIPYLEAPEEAEAQCAFLNMESVVDGVITEDSDAFLFGAQTVYRKLFSEGQFAEAYEATHIHSKLGLNRDLLIRLAYLLGSDYTVGVRGVGVVNSMEIIEAFPGEKGLEEFRDWTRKVTVFDEEPEDEVMTGRSPEAVRRRFCWKHRNMKRNWEIRPEFPNVAVAQAYLRPRIDPSTERFKWGRIDFAGLSRFCWERFGWESDRFEIAVGPLRKKLMDDRRERGQTRIDEFFKPHRFAKIRSVRLQNAVTGMVGEEATELMADRIGQPIVKRRKISAVSHVAVDSDEEKEMMAAVENSERELNEKNGLKR